MEGGECMEGKGRKHAWGKVLSHTRLGFVLGL